MKRQKKTQAIPSLSAAASEEEIIRWVQAHDVAERLDTGVSEVVEDHGDLEHIVEDAQYEGNTAQLNLRLPPSNRLEALKGQRKGQHSIRVNDQWRICFVWRDGHAESVEIVDYH